jgi:hypothetical protein
LSQGCDSNCCCIVGASITPRLTATPSAADPTAAIAARPMPPRLVDLTLRVASDARSDAISENDRLDDDIVSLTTHIFLNT